MKALISQMNHQLSWLWPEISEGKIYHTLSDLLPSIYIYQFGNKTYTIIFLYFRQNKLIPEDCPFSYEQVVEQVIDDFNQMLEDYRTKEGHPLSEDKKSEYRDLRRRGKNRVSI